MEREEVIRILKDRALREEYRIGNRIDVKRVLDEYYSLIES